MNKRIIFFDANLSVVPAIKYAKSRGLHVITCDNKPQNPGHKESDEALIISTYDTDLIDAYIEKNPVDGVVFFASSHGYFAGCHVIEKFHLPGISETTKETLSYKNNFRQFLQRNGFTSFPKFILFNGTSIPESIDSLTFPVIVKPTDRGGNKGITKVFQESELQSAVDKAHEESNSGNVVIEEFVDGNIQINGDCIIEDGILKIAFLGRYLYPAVNEILPCATIFGKGIIPEDLYNKVKDEIQKLVSALKIQSGAINVEFRVSSSGKIYFIEVNSRHSGNFIYSLMNRAYKISTEELAVKMALNEPLDIDKAEANGYFAYCLLYSEKDGILEDIKIDDYIKKYIVKELYFKQKGDAINKFKFLTDRVGLCLLEFPSYDELISVTHNFKNYFHITLQDHDI